MKSLIDLMGVVLADAGTRCGVCTRRDWITITSRVEHEGLSFLTIVLPSFCADFERSLSDGRVGHSSFLGFQRKRGLPRFLGGFLDLVFNRSDGVLREHPSVDAILCIRQLCLLLGKLHADCGLGRNRQAIRDYLTCEKEVRDWGSAVSGVLLGEFRSAFLRLWGDACQAMDTSVSTLSLVPRHGPGATADRLQGNQKWQQTEWTWRLESFFPSCDLLIPNPRYHQSLSTVNFLEPRKERPVKVTLVPKTPKSPRIIAIEPTCMQYAQQALLRLFVHEIDDSCRSTSWIGILDQTPNRRMAQTGSIGGLSTIDLSEASDRVSNVLVSHAFKPFANLHGALQACRTRRASVPGRTRPITLAKFASMGSAVCFPVEAMVFSTIVLIGIERQLSRRLSRREIHSLVGKVRVYGDDIIVPDDMALSVMEALSDFGLKVNHRKTFWSGNFRESCGKEYFRGEDVSITRVREALPSSRRDTRAVVSTASLRNQLYRAGFWQTCAYLDRLMSRLGPWPIVEPTAEAIGRHSFLGSQGVKLDPRTHRPLVKAMVLKSRSPSSPLSGEGALLKFFLTRHELPTMEGHLEYCGRPRSAHIKTAWTSVY